MDVLYWSSAGLILTWWCNARCASCYVSSSPDHDQWMSNADALRYWGQLQDGSPHGCKMHLTGGEPFGRWDQLLDLCEQAKKLGLGPLKKIETNAFWATDANIAVERIKALRSQGMEKLCISADPYHQQFIPIARARTAAAAAEEVLGADNVQIRWEKWLREGFDTSSLDEKARQELFYSMAFESHLRWQGRAAKELVESQEVKPISDLADNPCNGALLRSKHVHVGPTGLVMPGTCVGIILGKVGKLNIAEIWQNLVDDYTTRAIVGPLCSLGPVGLLETAKKTGFAPAKAYATKCHLCWELRNFLAGKGKNQDELGPGWMYTSS